jgi:hypothetical protein
MKKLNILFILFLMANICFARRIKISENLIIEGEIISASNGCIIIETKNEQGNPLFWIISEITNAFLPDVANFVCLKIAGEENQEICDEISNGISFITSLVDVGRSVPKVIRNAISLIAERGSVKSGLHFATESLQLAYNVKSTLEAYKKLGIVNWSDVSGNYTNNETNNYIGSVTIANVTNGFLNFSFSKDGVNWITKTLDPGKSFSINFWDGYLKQSYGFVKGTNICSYQIFTNKTYKIRYNKITKEYYLQTL